jgi:phage tail protein X
MTTLFSSFTENEPVKGARGGMADSIARREGASRAGCNEAVLLAGSGVVDKASPLTCVRLC